MADKTVTNEVHKVIILGSGPAGLTAAIYTARANLSPLVIHGPLPGGQLTMTTEVENYPGFPKGILGPELMQLLEEQAQHFGAKVITDVVSKVDLSSRPFRIITSNFTYLSETLIVATGATSKTLGLAREKELLGYGLSTCATCDGAFSKDKVIMVVGGGDSACEEALFLTRFGRKVLLVHRRDKLRASKIMQERVLKHEKITPIWNRIVKDLRGNRQSGITGVVLSDPETGAEEQVDCDAVFVAIGHSPNSELFKDYLTLDQVGYIVHQPNSAATSVAGVFVCGDVQDHVYRQAVTAAGSGCMAAIEAERWLELAR